METSYGRSGQKSQQETLFLLASASEAAHYSWHAYTLVPVPLPEIYKASTNLDLQLDSNGW
jgi:hypothetical protein